MTTDEIAVFHLRTSRKGSDERDELIALPYSNGKGGSIVLISFLQDNDTGFGV